MLVSSLPGFCAIVRAFMSMMFQVRAVVAEDAHWCPAGHEVLCQQYDISEEWLKTIAVGMEAPKAPKAIQKQPVPAGVHVDTQPGQHVTITASGTLPGNRLTMCLEFPQSLVNLLLRASATHALSQGCRL